MDRTGLRQLDIGFPVPEVNALALPERKVFKPIYQMGKWFARRSSAVFRALLLAAALPAEPPDDFKACIRAMLKERGAGSNGQEPTDDEVDREARRLYLMAMFYRNNQENPYTKGLIVLDPFMGGGTTIVEAARLGMKPIGVDLNPVAWFITKTELEPVSLPLLKQAFEQLRERPVILPDPAPAGVPTTLEKFVKHWYTTRCPSCGGDAELVYALWVKRHRCLNALCEAPEVRFFKNYLVTQKELGVSFIEDCICPACSTEKETKTFDWELEAASLLFLPSLANQITVPGMDAGANRKIHGGGHKIRWSCARWPGPVRCPHCNNDVLPTHRQVVEKTTRTEGKETRTYRQDPIAFAGQPIVSGKFVQTKGKKSSLAGRETPKKVQITVFLNPKDGALWEYRGELPTATTPRPWNESGKKKSDQDEPEARAFVPMPDGSRVWLDEGTEADGVYLCSGSQPHRSTIFEAGTKQLQENKRPTPFAMDCYAIEGYCPHCVAAKDAEAVKVRWAAKNQQPTLFGDAPAPIAQGRWDFRETKPRGTDFPMSAANYRFFKTPDPADLRRIEQAESIWEKVKDQLVWPKGHAIPYGDKTREDTELWVHGFHDWSDMFFRRQLLGLAQIITAIGSASRWVSTPTEDLRLRIVDAFACAFARALENCNISCRYNAARNEAEGILSRHDFHPKSTAAEANPWGGELGRSTFQNCVDQVVRGFEFAYCPYDDGRPFGTDKSQAFQRNPFVLVPTSLAADGKTVLPFNLINKKQLREMIDELVDPPHGAPSLNGTLRRTAILDEGNRVYPWDGISHLHVTNLRGRSDFTLLRTQEQASVGLINGDSREIRPIPDGSVDLVITDPPFGDNVNYADLSDFFYVWLAAILKERFLDAQGNDVFDHWEDEIMPRGKAESDGIGFTEDPSLPPNFVRRRRLLQTPKLKEMIESRASRQRKTARDYHDALTAAFAEAHRKLKQDGLLAFTFHHNDVRAWWAVVAALLECVPSDQHGFHLESVYPIVGEAETTTHHNETQNATFDIIHVCRKRTALPTSIKWAVFRRRVREAVRKKREELLSIPAYNPQEGGYVTRNDLRMILLGVGFQLYSEHYGRVEFPENFLKQAQAAPRGRRGKRSIEEAADLLRRDSDPGDDTSARNLREVTYAIDEILDEIEHEQANPLPPELENLAGEVDRISRFYFKHLLPEHGRTIKYDDLKQLEYRTGVSVKDMTDADVLGTRHRNREYEIKRPLERYRRLRERFLDERPPLGVLDRVHFLIGAIDDAAWAQRNKVDPMRIDEFHVEGKPMDEAWAEQKEQMVAAIRMIAGHAVEEETKMACGRALKWLAPAADLFTPATQAKAKEG